MNTKKSLLWITRTAVLTALLITVQFATAPLGNQFVTGSIVNLILIVSVITCGLSSGTTVACISPVFARLLGIGTPFWTLVPFIAAGNLVLVLLWHTLGGRAGSKKIWYPVALATAAVAKFATLYVGIAVVAIPLLLKLPQPQAEKVSAAFSFPQLITAAIGGALAIAVLPLLNRALNRDNPNA